MWQRLNSPFAVTASRLGASALSFVSAPIISHTLGVEGRGLTATAIAVVGILPIIIGLGVPMAVRRRAAISAAAESSRLAAQVRALVLYLLPLAVVLSFVIANIVFADATFQDRIAFQAAVSVTPFSLIWICDANILLASNRFRAFALLNAAPTAIFVAIIAATAVAGIITVALVIVAVSLGMVVTSVLSSLLIRARVSRASWRVGGLTSDGLRFVGSQIAEAASYRLDQVVVLPLLGSAVAGIYSVASTLTLVPYAFAQGIGAVLFRRIANADDEEIEDEFGSVVRIATATGIVVSAALAASLPIAIPLIFGHSFSASIFPTVIGLIGSVFLVIAYSCSIALAARGNGISTTIAQISGLIAGITLLFVLGPPFGAMGAATASTIGFAVTACCAIAMMRLPARAFLPRRSDLSIMKDLFHVD